jgi:hypothetical protein
MELILVKNAKKVKFHPFCPQHLCILSDRFQIFAYVKNLDDPQFEKELKAPMEDFCFAENSDYFDLAKFAIFFVSSFKEIFVLCPILLDGFEFNEKHLQTFKAQAFKDKKSKLLEFLDFLQTNSSYIIEKNSKIRQLI